MSLKDSMEIAALRMNISNNNHSQYAQHWYFVVVYEQPRSVAVWCSNTKIICYVSFAKEPYKRDDILQKRPTIWRIKIICTALLSLMSQKNRVHYTTLMSSELIYFSPMEYHLRSLSLYTTPADWWLGSFDLIYSNLIRTNLIESHGIWPHISLIAHHTCRLIILHIWFNQTSLSLYTPPADWSSRVEWRGLKNRRWQLIHRKVVFCIFRCQSIWVGISGDNLEKWQIPRQSDINYLGENTRFIAPSTCCKPSPLLSWIWCGYDE